jgi:hypothetical protein
MVRGPGCETPYPQTDYHINDINQMACFAQNEGKPQEQANCQVTVRDEITAHTVHASMLSLIADAVVQYLRSSCAYSKEACSAQGRSTILSPLPPFRVLICNISIAITCTLLSIFILDRSLLH